MFLYVCCSAALFLNLDATQLERLFERLAKLDADEGGARTLSWPAFARLCSVCRGSLADRVAFGVELLGDESLSIGAQIRAAIDFTWRTSDNFCDTDADRGGDSEYVRWLDAFIDMLLEQIGDADSPPLSVDEQVVERTVALLQPAWDDLQAGRQAPGVAEHLAEGASVTIM